MNRPRLGPKEGELWKDFLQSKGHLFTDYQYDIRVIPVSSSLAVERGEYRHNWDQLTCPRVDVVAKDSHQRTALIEVRPQADADAVLRLIGYKELLKTLGKLPGAHTLVVVCRSITPVTQNLCDAYGVKVFAVSPSVRDLSLKNQGKLPVAT